MASNGDTLQALEPLIGEWIVLARFGDTPATDIGARVTFEWFEGRKFVVQRWTVPIPEAPDGIALIGADPEREDGYLQHYFDSRGVARVYRMSFGEGTWKLWRDTPDFSPLDFSQRYTGRFSDDGRTITGMWEISHDHETWEKDFDQSYEKLA